MRLRMLISVKISNIRNTGLWYQNGSEKTHITVNGVAMTPPETDVVYDEYEDLHNPSGASDGSNLSVPVWIDLGEINIVAGENVIEITNMMSSYSYFICGVGLSIV